MNERPYDQPATQDQRREILRNDARVRNAFADSAKPPETTTYHAKGIVEADEEMQGRFANASPKVVVVGSGSPVLPGPAWCIDPVPAEPPIDATDCGDVLGVALGGASPPKDDADDV